MPTTRESIETVVQENLGRGAQRAFQQLIHDRENREWIEGTAHTKAKLYLGYSTYATSGDPTEQWFTHLLEDNSAKSFYDIMESGQRILRQLTESNTVMGALWGTLKGPTDTLMKTMVSLDYSVLETQQERDEVDLALILAYAYLNCSSDRHQPPTSTAAPSPTPNPSGSTFFGGGFASDDIEDFWRRNAEQ